MASIALITVAGISSRFNRNQPVKTLKAIYHEGNPQHTCLYRLCRQCQTCDGIIVVGGYQFKSLTNYIDRMMPSELRAKITTVFNPHYADYASGFSIYSGLQTAFAVDDLKEIIFIEGDLIVDTPSLTNVLKAEGDVITYNRESVDSRKSVVLYDDAEGKFHYKYSAKHGLLSIEEPFRHIWNSGQIWKFTSVEALKRACSSFVEECISGVGLNLVQRYFDQILPEKVRTIAIEHWFNCNTREDYSGAFDFASTEV